MLKWVFQARFKQTNKQASERANKHITSSFNSTASLIRTACSFQVALWKRLAYLEHLEKKLEEILLLFHFFFFFQKRVEPIYPGRPGPLQMDSRQPHLLHPLLMSGAKRNRSEENELHSLCSLCLLHKWLRFIASTLIFSHWPLITLQDCLQMIVCNINIYTSLLILVPRCKQVILFMYMIDRSGRRYRCWVKCKLNTIPVGHRLTAKMDGLCPGPIGPVFWDLSPSECSNT